MFTDPHWEKIGKRPHHGITVPLFSLRSKKSCGIGEFLDLIPLIDWCKNLGFDVIQLLPLNDTGEDRSPYNPVSSVAIDPIYLSIKDINNSGNLSFDAFDPLSSLPRLVRFEVKRQKMKWLYTYFEQEFSSVAQSPAYRLFLENNRWVYSYALFKAIKDEYVGKSWTEWPP